MSIIAQNPPSQTLAQRPQSAAWRRESSSAELPKHEWQTVRNDGVRSALVSARIRIAIGLLLILFLGLSGLLVYELLLLPARTMVVAAVAEDYRWPLPPCGWSHEDIDALKANLGGQTLAIQDLSLSGLSSSKALAEFTVQFGRLARQTHRDGAAIVYISAHGVVDGQGRPCLLLPGDDPLDSSSWLRMSDLLAQIKATQRQASMHWLIILDANRQSENWNIGLLQNTFADGLAKAVADSGVPHLAVLNSVSSGQIAWSSLHFRGTVFGHFLQLGLAGAADENGDGQVSLLELQKYLKTNVDAWTCKHRAAHQTPSLYTSDAGDSVVCWSLNPKDLARLTAPVAKHANADEASAGNKLAPLWLKHEQLAKQFPNHYAPAKWQEVEHDLVWIGEAATSGAAYRDSFQLTVDRMQGELDAATRWLQTAILNGHGAVAPVRFSSALSADATMPLDELQAFSQPLANYLGAGNAPNTVHSVAQYSDAELARLYQHYGVTQLWPSGDVVRQTIDLHKLGQLLSVPGIDAKTAADGRAHAMIRPLLDGADQLRRLTEDSVFLGPKAAADFNARLDRAKQKYGDLAEMELAFAKSYQLRDRVWSEIPYLAQWVAWQEESLGAQAPADAIKPGAETLAPKKKILLLIDSVKQLDGVLGRAERASAQGAANADKLAALSRTAAAAAHDADDLLEQYHGQLRNEARRLPLAQATPIVLRELEEMLSMPLVSGSIRADLYTRLVEVTEEIDSDTPGNKFQNNKAQSKDGKPPNPTVAIAPTVVNTVPTAANVRWAFHPMASLLELPEEQAKLVEMGEKLRAVLGGNVATVDAGKSLVSTANDANPQNSASATGSELLATDRSLRRFVSLKGASQLGAFRRIDRRQLQDLLLWQGQRALDDFYGTIVAGRQQYFAQVAEAYMTDVRLLAHPDADVDRGLQRLSALLARRSDAASRGLATTSTDLVLIDEETAATANVGIWNTAATPGFPDGIAAVFLRDDNSILPQTLHSLEVGPDSDASKESQRKIAITVHARDLANRTATMQTVAMFRGHEFPTPMMQREVSGPLVDVQRHTINTSHITLRGSRAKKASLVFILDCSHSMADPVPVEGPESANHHSQLSKLNIAVEAMTGMLERLGEPGDVRVGVRFFGHRAGWRTDQDGVIAKQESYPGGVPASLHPYEDIELFLPLGRFDSIMAGTVVQRLRLLKPWGESPIFLSLREALNDFNDDDALTERRVVVITDGMNYQFNPPPEAAPSLKDVQTAYVDRGIHVDIVGFGIPAEERTTAVRDFTQLAEKTNGTFTLAMNASSLMKRLDQLLVKTHFRVLDGTGQTVGESLLGGSIAVKLPEHSQGGVAQSCTIEVEQLSAKTLLHGGESLQLAISQDGRKIISLPYEEENPILVPLITADSASPTPYHVGLHRRIRETDAVVFPISFQRDDLGIPQPPAQVWIEITPLNQGRRMLSNGYVFYDENFEPEMPVPLMRCRCANWPKEANQAEVRLWCSDQPIEPTEIVPLANVVNQTPPSGEGFELTSMAGVRYQVRSVDRTKDGQGLQIRVIERHQPGVPVNAMKLEMLGRPRRITHQYDWERGIVLHWFEYDTSAFGAKGPMELRFCTRDKFTSAAWRTEQPVTVDIARHIEVILPPQLIDPRVPANPPRE